MTIEIAVLFCSTFKCVVIMSILKPQTNRKIRKRRPNSPHQNLRSCSTRLERLALPNLHVVAGVLKDHFKTLNGNHVKRLKNLIDLIKCNKEVHEEFVARLDDELKDNDNELYQLFDGVSKREEENSWYSESKHVGWLPLKSASEAYLVTVQTQSKEDNLYSTVSEIDENNYRKPVKNFDSKEIIILKPSRPRTTYKSVNTSNLNLVDVGTCYSVLSANRSLPKFSSYDCQLSSPSKISLAGSQSPINIPSINFIESKDTFYTCSTEFNSFNNEKLVVIKIRLCNDANDISVDCKLTNTKVQRNISLESGENTNAIQRLYQSFKESLWEVLRLTKLSAFFRDVYLCLLGIIDVFRCLCKNPRKSRYLHNRMCTYSKQTAVRRSIKKTLSSKKMEIVDTYRVDNVCSILS